jgi:magnesium chelatase family protein
MAIATVLSREQRGIDAPQVRVEVDIGSGLPTFNIVGLPEAVVKESKDRVRAALTNSDFQFPSGRITVNLAPADLPKEGGRFDLPIAIGILSASGQLTDARSELQGCELYGELSLSGELRSMRGVLPAALAASVARHPEIVPHINAAEAALVKNCEVIAARHILEVCAHLDGADRLGLYRAEPPAIARTALPDLCDVRGQLHARRALEIAAAGQHSLLPWPSSAEVPTPGRERFPWPITAYCFSMNCRNSTGMSWKCFASRWKQARLRFHVRRARRNSRRASN